MSLTKGRIIFLYIGVSVILLDSSCARTMSKLPVMTADVLRVKIFGHKQSRRDFSAEIELLYFDNKTRLHGRGSLLVVAPDKLRYNLEGPHGGVLQAFASDGQNLSLMDLTKKKL